MSIIAELEARRQHAIAGWVAAESDADLNHHVGRQVTIEDAILAADPVDRGDLATKFQIWRALIEDPASILDKHLPLFDRLVADIGKL